MREKVSLLLTLAAWLLATGSHWDLVQTFAWGRMLASYSQVMPFSKAVAKTFSPQTMCSLCHAVADAKQQESNGATAPGTKTPGKILLVCAPRTLVFSSPAPHCAGLIAPESAPSSLDRSRPPSPPPRELA